MEVWSTRPKPIGGGAMVRQLFRVGGGRETEITGAWLRARRLEHATASLELGIEQVTGATLTSASVTAADVPSRGPRWVHVRVPSPVSLPAGANVLTASAQGRPSYEAFPIRKGTEFGFGRPTVFDGGYAQFNDGSGWIGWAQWAGAMSEPATCSSRSTPSPGEE